MLRLTPLASIVGSVALHASVIGGFCWLGFPGSKKPALPFAAGDFAQVEVQLNLRSTPRPRLALAPPSAPPAAESHSISAAEILPLPSPEPRNVPQAQSAVDLTLEPRLDPLVEEWAPPTIRSRTGVRSSVKSDNGIRLPEYPEKCNRLRHEGTCTLEILVDEQGRIASVRVLESTGCADLDNCALKAVRDAAQRGWLIEADELPCKLIQPIKFELPKR